MQYDLDTGFDSGWLGTDSERLEEAVRTAHAKAGISFVDVDLGRAWFDEDLQAWVDPSGCPPPSTAVLHEEGEPRFSMPGEYLHAPLHVNAERWIAELPSVRARFDGMVAEGHDRHTLLHAIGWMEPDGRPAYRCGDAVAEPIGEVIDETTGACRQIGPYDDVMDRFASVVVTHLESLRPLTGDEWREAPPAHPLQGEGFDSMSAETHEIDFTSRYYPIGGSASNLYRLPDPSEMWFTRLSNGFYASPEAETVSFNGWFSEMITVCWEGDRDIRSLSAPDVTEFALALADKNTNPQAKPADCVSELAAFFRYCTRAFGMPEGPACVAALEDPALLSRLETRSPPPTE